jgi:DNA-binding response OmpR family regulator
MRILVVEDDEAIADIIRCGLVAQHYYVDIAADGETAVDLAWSNDYDLLILDIMLPKKNGRDVCRELRDEGLMTPILMLTALASEEDMISGLDIGADDYLTKPFSFNVLLARVRSLTRRQSEQKTAEIAVADLVLDTARRRVQRSGKAIELTAKEFALLEYFVLNKGKVLTREAISEHVWDMHFDPRSNVIESLMKCLRQKVDKDYSVQLIHTIRGIGYRLDERYAG